MLSSLVALGKTGVIDSLFMKENGTFLVTGEDGVQRVGEWVYLHTRMGVRSVRLYIGDIQITARELQILAELKKSVRQRAAGESLGLSHNTVKNAKLSTERRNGLNVMLDLNRYGILNEDFVSNLAQAWENGAELYVFDLKT